MTNTNHSSLLSLGKPIPILLKSCNGSWELCKQTAVSTVNDGFNSLDEKIDVNSKIGKDTSRKIFRRMNRYDVYLD